MTQWIPLRLRGVLLVLGIVILFPLIVGAIMLDAVTHEMPRLRAPLKKVVLAVSDWVRAGAGIFRGKRTSASAQFGGMIQEQSSLAS